jgi:hypothetical protein
MVMAGLAARRLPRQASALPTLELMGQEDRLCAQLRMRVMISFWPGGLRPAQFPPVSCAALSLAASFLTNAAARSAVTEPLASILV